VILTHDVNLHLAEAPPQSHVVRGGQVLISEQQELVAQKCRVKPRIQAIVDRLPEIHTAELGAEGRAEGTNFEFVAVHLGSLRSTGTRDPTAYSSNRISVGDPRREPRL